MTSEQKSWYIFFAVIGAFITPIGLVFRGGPVAIITWWVFYITIGILKVKSTFVKKIKKVVKTTRRSKQMKQWERSKQRKETV